LVDAEAGSERERRVRVAGRALARAGLVHAFGHCSERVDESHFLVCAAKPMGLLRIRDAGSLVAIGEPLPEGVLGEVRIHQQVYRKRRDVNGVVRFMSPSVVTLSAMQRTSPVRHGAGSYFAPQPPFWHDPQLIRTDELAEGVASTLEHQRAVVMRGNGAVTAGDSLEQAVVLAWFLEESSRVDLALLQAGGGAAPALTSAEARQRATGDGRIFERMWDYLTYGDPELEFT